MEKGDQRRGSWCFFGNVRGNKKKKGGGDDLLCNLKKKKKRISAFTIVRVCYLVILGIKANYISVHEEPSVFPFCFPL